VPRGRVKGKFMRPEAEALEGMRLTFFDDLVIPQDEEPGGATYVQMMLDEASADTPSDEEEEDA